MNRRLILLGLLLLVISNVVILTKVAYNRAAEVATLTFTERELPSVYRYMMKENSAQALRLKWNTARLNDEGSYSYYDKKLTVSEDELQALGLETECEDGRYAYTDNERKAWILMELDGKHYRNELQLEQAELAQQKSELQVLLAHGAESEALDKLKREAESTEYRIERLKDDDSRLYAIAVSATAEPLLAAMRANNTQFVVRGTVKNSYYCDNTLRITRLFIDRLHLEKSVLPTEGDLAQHYSVDVAIGNLGEAWVKQITPRTVIAE